MKLEEIKLELDKLGIPVEIETMEPSSQRIALRESKEKLLQQGWEEVTHKGKVIGYLNPSVSMSHPVYNLQQAMEVYRWMNEERYGQVKLPWEA